jgi:rRNA maturation RNase YbeY
MSSASGLLTDIVVQNPHRYPGLEVARLRDWLAGLVAELTFDAASFGVRLVDDGEMRSLNRQFRGKDAPTDVLSFPGGESAEGRHLGDVVISIPTTRSQARRQGHSTQRELRLLLVHGVLHCLGYDHEKDSGEMERIEAELRKKWLADVD